MDTVTRYWGHGAGARAAMLKGAMPSLQHWKGAWVQESTSEAGNQRVTTGAFLYGLHT